MANEFDKINTVQDLLLVNEVKSGPEKKVSKADQTVKLLLDKNKPAFILNVTTQLAEALQHYHVNVSNQLIEAKESELAANWAIDSARLEIVVNTLNEITL
jgi:hypothetical protein